MLLRCRDERHWRKRAEEARAMADETADPKSKKAMLAVTEAFERMALDAEQTKSLSLCGPNRGLFRLFRRN